VDKQAILKLKTDVSGLIHSLLGTMRMLTEVLKTRQIEGEDRRRWFSSNEMDLIFWYSADGAVSGFELCYDKDSEEKALIWRVPAKTHHVSVDPGEPLVMGYKMTPIHVPGGIPDFEYIRGVFESASSALPFEIRDLALNVLSQQNT